MIFKLSSSFVVSIQLYHIWEDNHYVQICASYIRVTRQTKTGHVYVHNYKHSFLSMIIMCMQLVLLVLCL